jgi:hypothetical protein
MRGRHAVLKEKWANDRETEVGEAGTVSAAAKVFWDQFQAEVRRVAFRVWVRAGGGLQQK